jgi:hypothetical protein
VNFQREVCICNFTSTIYSMQIEQTIWLVENKKQNVTIELENLNKNKINKNKKSRLYNVHFAKKKKKKKYLRTNVELNRVRQDYFLHFESSISRLDEENSTNEALRVIQTLYLHQKPFLL